MVAPIGILIATVSRRGDGLGVALQLTVSHKCCHLAQGVKGDERQ